jgi:hypothetical protein
MLKNLIFVAFFLLDATTAHGQKAAPHIVFDTIMYDLGNIPERGDWSHMDITFRNVSKDTLYIWRGNSNDGGFWVCGFQKIVPPHSVGHLTYCMNFGRLGPFYKFINLSYDLDPNKQDLLYSPIIHVKGVVLKQDAALPIKESLLLQPVSK